MCLPLIAIGVSLMGAITQANAAKSQAQAANAAAEYNAKVMQRNAEIATMQADAATKQGEIDAREHKLKVAGLIGSQRASYGASGVLVDSGSPVDISADTAAEGELDAMTIRRNAQRQAYGYQTQALNYSNEAQLSLMKKQDVGLAYKSSLLTGVGNTLVTAAQLMK